MITMHTKVYKQWELPDNSDVRLTDEKGVVKMVKYLKMDGMYAQWWDESMPEGEKMRIGNFKGFIKVGESNPTGSWFEPIGEMQ